MFSDIIKRLHTVFKLKVSLTLFVLVLITLAFVNFFILISLKTNAHEQPESLLDSLFLINIHRNVSVFAHDKRKVNLNETKKMTRGDAVNISDSTRGKLRDKAKRRSRTTARFKTRTTIQQSLPREGENFLKHMKTPKTNNGRVYLPSTSGLDCTSWCRRGNGLKPPYLLTAVLLVRIYRDDLAKLSSREMTQWFQYLRYAGFQHIYVYDAYVKPTESQRDVMKPFVQSGFATYIDWSIHNPYTIQGTQVAAYQDCIDKFGKDSKWQAAIDIDEYPFSPRDLEENFMSRFLDEYSRNNPDVSEITMQNYLFLGKPINDAKEPLLIARIRRRTHQPANQLVKPIYKPDAISWAQVHHNGVRSGSSQDSPAEMLRMNHYWGARLQDWGDDTPKVLDMTEPDYTIKPIVEKVKRCASCFGQDSLYAKRWA